MFYWLFTCLSLLKTRFCPGLKNRCCNVFLLVLVCLVQLMPCSASAHPHVYVEARVDVVFDDNGLAGFKVTWVFDEMFSNMIAYDFDTNGNHGFDPGEVEGVRKGAFSNLREFGYFTRIRIKGKPFVVEFVKDFSVILHEGVMTYVFFIPCHVRAATAAKEIRFSMYDDTYYTDIALARDPVKVNAAERFEVGWDIEENLADAFYYGQIYPEDIIITFKERQ
jgi:ABC-type uncharacterized transport system substrate-binding protein